MNKIKSIGVTGAKGYRHWIFWDSIWTGDVMT